MTFSRRSIAGSNLVAAVWQMVVSVAVCFSISRAMEMISSWTALISLSALVSIDLVRLCSAMPAT